jgi:hypothetical protein
MIKILVAAWRLGPKSRALRADPSLTARSSGLCWAGVEEWVGVEELETEASWAARWRSAMLGSGREVLTQHFAEVAADLRGHSPETLLEHHAKRRDSLTSEPPNTSAASVASSRCWSSDRSGVSGERGLDRAGLVLAGRVSWWLRSTPGDTSAEIHRMFG